MNIYDEGLPKDKCSSTDFGEVFGRCPGLVTIRETLLGLVILRALDSRCNGSRGPAFCRARRTCQT